MLYQLSYLGIREQRARSAGGYRKGVRRSSRLRRGWRIVVQVGGRAGHDVLAGEPTPEIDLGAARAAERAAGGDGRAVADRAAPKGTGGGVGLGAADRSSRQVRDFLADCGARPPRVRIG